MEMSKSVSDQLLSVFIALLTSHLASSQTQSLTSSGNLVSESRASIVHPPAKHGCQYSNGDIVIVIVASVFITLIVAALSLLLLWFLWRTNRINLSTFQLNYYY